MNKHLYILLLWGSVCEAVPRINLFRPTDRPLIPDPVAPFNGSCFGGQFSAAYEGAFHIRAFRDDYDDRLEAHPKEHSDEKKKGSVFSLFEDRHSFLGALKGFDSTTLPGQLSQQANIDEEADGRGFYRPHGSLHVPLNLLLAQRWYVGHGLDIGVFLPVIHAELTDVLWKRVDTEIPQEVSGNLLHEVESVTGINLGGWKRTGIGDLVLQAEWMRDFAQNRPFLTDVRVMTRLGLVFPTGKRADEDKLLSFPFGNDGAWALQFAGGLDLTFGYTFRGGIDVEFLYQFGNTTCRRIKTAPEQTSLLLLKKVPVYLESGLGQQYNIYLESCNFWGNSSFKVNYQFLKRNDDRIDLGTDRSSSFIANSAENLFDWTAHSLIFMAHHAVFDPTEEHSFYPSCLLWFKWGFNGKHSLVGNSVGLQLNVAF